MLNGKIILFQRTKELNAKITEFLNNISESGIIFKKACDSYMLSGANEDFEENLKSVSALEARNDQLRRSIETKLYAHTLIPESRSDVLQLLEGLDKIVNMFEGHLYKFAIEQFKINDDFKPLYSELVESVINSVEALVRSSRAFFINISEVNDHIHKVMFFEKQADMVGTKLKKQIFADENMELAHKIQLRMLCDDIDGIADLSEDISDQLSIYTIKRSV